MNSLFADVVENAYNNYGGYYGDTQLSPSVEAAIESRVTDDPVSMVGYTSECITGMVAIEAALATVEGRCAVDYLRATTETARVEIKATMEGAISRAWESLKDFIMRAWKAIKKFLQKAWNRIKAAASTIKAMLTKYEKVLRDWKGNVKVTWYKQLDLTQMMATKDKQLEKLDTMMHPMYELLKTRVDNDRLDDLPGVVSARGEDDGNGTTRTAGTSFSGNTKIQAGFDYIRNTDFRKELMIVLYGSEHGIQHIESDWKKRKVEALAVADGDEDKQIEDHLKIGEKSEREMLNDMRDFQDKVEDMSDENGAPTMFIRSVNGLVRAKIMIHREANQLLISAVQQKRSLAIAACRKAIKSMHGVKENYEPNVNQTDFDAVMAQMI